MERFFTAVLYILWTLTLVGILMVTFTNFQYSDLNVAVVFLAVFTLINTYFSLKQKR